MQHKFRILWSETGWHTRGGPNEPSCWGADLQGWLEHVAKAEGCRRHWGGLGTAYPTVFGYKETMESYCNDENGRGWNWWGDVAGCCGDAHFNVLRIPDWEMCKNVEWMWCVIRGASGEIRFTKEPAYIDASLSSHYSDNMYGFEENDIYALELCLLNEMCVNGDEIFAKRVGEPFHCVPDEGKWQSFGRDLLELERGAAWKADAWS